MNIDLEDIPWYFLFASMIAAFIYGIWIHSWIWIGLAFSPIILLCLLAAAINIAYIRKQNGKHR